MKYRQKINSIFVQSECVLLHISSPPSSSPLLGFFFVLFFFGSGKITCSVINNDCNCIRDEHLHGDSVIISPGRWERDSLPGCISAFSDKLKINMKHQVFLFHAASQTGINNALKKQECGSCSGRLSSRLSRILPRGVKKKNKTESSMTGPDRDAGVGEGGRSE